MYTTKQVAEKLGISHGTLRAYIASGRVKVTKLGHTNIIDDKEMKRLEEKYANRNGKAGRPKGS